MLSVCAVVVPATPKIDIGEVEAIPTLSVPALRKNKSATLSPSIEKSIFAVVLLNAHREPVASTELTAFISTVS